MPEVAAGPHTWRQGLTLVCNLYSLNKKRDMLARYFRVSHNRTVAFDPLSAVFPGHVAPVVRQTADGEREIVLMNWRFVLPQRDKAPRRVTNVRDDKILESRLWRGSFEERRCYVVATSARCLPSLVSGAATKGPSKRTDQKLTSRSTRSSPPHPTIWWRLSITRECPCC